MKWNQNLLFENKLLVEGGIAQCAIEFAASNTLFGSLIEGGNGRIGQINTVCDEYAASLLDGGFPLLGEYPLFDTSIRPWGTNTKGSLSFRAVKGKYVYSFHVERGFAQGFLPKCPE